MTNLALDQDDKFKITEDRNSLSKIAGSAGFVMGIGLGAVGFGVVILGRIITNTVITAARVIGQATKIVFFQDNEISFEEEKDERPTFSKILGVPLGGLLGIGLGVPAAAIVFAIRVFMEVISSGIHAFCWVMDFALSKEMQFSNEPDKRSLVSKILGLPGLFVGGALGFASYGIVTVVRIVTNTIISIMQSFCWATNGALQEKDQISLHYERDVKSKILGVLGYPIGGVLGAVSFSVIMLGRFLNESRLSFQALSGSFLNAGMERIYFDGIADDKRTSGQKKAGFIGYALASVTALPTAVAIYAFRKLFPLALSLALSPIVFVCKFLSAACCCCCRPRFMSGNDKTDQLFKNLYSSLNAFGQLTKIKENGDGSTSRKLWIRKCLMLNVDTPTEKMLNAISREYREAGALDEKTFERAVQKIKDSYSNNSFFDTKEEIAELLEEVDRVSDFVRNYFSTEGAASEYQIAPPGGLFVKVTQTFFGSRHQNNRAKIADEKSDDEFSLQDPLLRPSAPAL